MLIMSRFVRFFAVTVLLALALAAPTFAAGNSFGLKAGLRWVVAATTVTLNEAVGIAHHFPDQRTMVVQIETGEYAVIIGPYRAKTVSQLTRKNTDIPALLSDARMSRGEDFKATVWTPENDTQRGVPAPLKTVKLGKTKSLESGGISLAVSFKKQKGGNVLQVSGVDADKVSFSFDLTKADALDTREASFGIYRVDKDAKFPQIIVTTYTGGAHCCTQTWIMTRPHDVRDWQAVDVGQHDGDGFALEDVNGDKTFEMITSDNAFLYSFDSYANSYAPVVYSQLAGDRLVDLSTTDSIHDELERDLAYIEYDAKTDPARWNSNGFLAGWVASKIRLGQGEDAWTVMLENFNHKAAGSVQECDPDLAECDKQLAETISFPKALAKFLQETGYGPLPITALSAVQ
jgi:serine protease Do